MSQGGTIAQRITDLIGATYNTEATYEGDLINAAINEIADMFGGNKVYGETRIEPKEIKKSNIESAKCFLDWRPCVKLEDWIPL